MVSISEVQHPANGFCSLFTVPDHVFTDELDAANRKAERERAELEAKQESQEQAINDAVQLEAQGDTKAAEAVLANPAPAPVRYTAPAPVAPKVSRTEGVGIGFDWDFRITNEALIPREHMLPNESSIRALGKTTKGKAIIAGVEFYEKPRVAASRGK
jgi:hypothetical protein